MALILTTMLDLFINAWSNCVWLVAAENKDRHRLGWIWNETTIQRSGNVPCGTDRETG